MRILHTADWHLGKKLDNYSRLEEQKEVMQEICEIADAEQADVILIAGDLYDTYTPPTEAVSLFYKTLKKLAKEGKRPVVAIAGNHDSPDRIEAPEPLAMECGIILLGYPYSEIKPFALETGLAVTRSEKGFLELKVPNQNELLRLILTPYANELRLKTYLAIDNKEEELRYLLQNKWQTLADKYCDMQGINILMAHLFFAKNGEPIPQENLDEEKSILYVGGAQAVYSEQIPAQMQYVALGHLHRKQLIDDTPCPMVYASSPLAYSFAETDQQKYVILIEAEAGKAVHYKSIPLQKGKRLLRARFDDIDKAVEWLAQNTNALVEITIETEKYLTAQERKKLNDIHSGICAIIPDVRRKDGIESSNKHIDITKNKIELFTDYFKYKNGGQVPNDRLLDLFKEITSIQSDEQEES